MKTEATQQAFPVQRTVTGHGEDYFETPGQPGLTKREYFAAMAMQGILASLNNDNQNKYTVNEGFLHGETIAKESLVCADALINELNKNDNP